MRRMLFLDENILAQEMNDICEKSKQFVSFYGFYDRAARVAQSLIWLGNPINFMEIGPEYYDGYDKEFIVTVDEDGVSVEKAFYEDNYLLSAPDIAYIDNECSSKILRSIESDECIEIEFSDDVDEDTDEKDNNDLVNCDDCPNRFECDEYKVANSKKENNNTVNIKVTSENGMNGIEVHKNTDNGYSNYSYHSSVFDSDELVEFVKKYFS